MWPLKLYGTSRPARFVRVAAAQYSCVTGDFLENIKRHIEFCRIAAEHSVSFLIFPELSLVGYDLESLHKHVISPFDECLLPFQQLASKNRMSISVGAPVMSIDGNGICIGTICFHPGRAPSVYRKFFLHPSESLYITEGEEQSHIFEISSAHVSLAICADVSNPAHASAAKQAGATLYAAGVLWTDNGYIKDAAIAIASARRNNFAVLVANHCTPTGSLDAVGLSALWGPDGTLLAMAELREQCLIIGDCDSTIWSAKRVIV